MMYIEKRDPIKAEVYRDGLEDGRQNVEVGIYHTINNKAISDIVKKFMLETIKEWYGEDVANDLTATVQLPYIIIDDAMAYIRPGDYITTDEFGDKNLIRKEVFEKRFEEYQEHTEPKPGDIIGVNINTPNLSQIAMDLANYAATHGDIPLVAVTLNGTEEEPLIDQIYNLRAIVDIPGFQDKTICGISLSKAEPITKDKTELQNNIKEILKGIKVDY